MDSARERMRLLTDKIDFIQQEGDKSRSLLNTLNGFEEYTLDNKGLIISSNLEAVNVTGYEEWEVIGKSISLLYNDQDNEKDLASAHLSAASDKGSLVNIDWKVKKKKIPFLCKMRIIPLRNTFQEVAGYKVIVRDVTYKALYSNKVSKIWKEYNNLYQSSTIGIFKLRISDGALLDINHRGRSILKLSQASVAHLTNVFEDPASYKTMISKLQKRKKLVNYEMKTISDAWISIDCKLFEAEGYAEGVIFDITYQKSQLLEIEKLKKELNTLIYQASHHLRSPITTMLGLVNLLRIEYKSSSISTPQYIQMMEERLHHLDIVLRNISSISFNNNTELKIDEIRFEEEVMRVFETYRNSPVRFIYEGTQTKSFFTDSLRLRAILKHLIDNSIKFRNNSTDSEVRVNVKIRNSIVYVSVSDNGLGMTDSDLMNIYEMFYRGNDIASGAGLGLFIVKGMVERLGGKIQVESKFGSGTTFSFAIPEQIKDNKSIMTI
jgi:PAS domain S-box-containing protein